MNKTSLKDTLTRLGCFIRPTWVHNANGILNYLFIGWWMKERGFHIPQRWTERSDLYSHLAKPLANTPTSYLEFGVYKGESLRMWTGLLRHPRTRFFGFDSFEGLPESWVLSCGKGAFDVDGSLPTIDDPRVTLLKGWFTDTLPPFIREFTRGERLILHLDADLYSSTIYVLRLVGPFLTTGDILIFDELFDRNHELKALEEFLDETKTELECLGSTVGLQRVAFRIIGPSKIEGSSRC